MELEIKARKAEKKIENKKIRRAGGIPAIIYSQGKVGTTFEVDAVAFQKVLNQIVPGTLSTTIFTLKEGSKTKKAIVKDIQYHRTSYNVIHLDFEELIDSVPVSLNVPIQCVGVVDCIGIKLGGNLRQVSRSLKVKALPKDIPSHIEIDITNMNVGEEKKLADIAIPSGVRPLSDMNTLAVVIAKK